MPAAVHPSAGFVVTTLAAVGMALALAAPPVARLLGIAVDPIGRLSRMRRARRPDPRSA